MNTPEILVILPLLVAFLLPILYRLHPLLGSELGPLTLLVHFGLCLLLLQSTPTQIFVVDQPLKIIFFTDQLSLIVVALLSASALLLWPRGDQDPWRESCLMLLLIAGGTGFVLSADLFNLWLWYQLMTLSACALIAMVGKSNAIIASWRYLLLNASGSILSLFGLALLYVVTGTLNLVQIAALPVHILEVPTALTAFVLLFLGFGITAGIFPVSFWLPETTAVAGHKVASLLAGLLSKLALLVILRLLLLFADTEAPQLVLLFALFGLITSELAALRANTLAQLLGYSTVGQMSLAFIAITLLSQEGITAAFVLLFHHLLITPALFFVTAGWKGKISSLTAMARKSPWAAALFVILALSLLGVPPLPGFWAKYLLLNALLELELVWIVLLMIVTTILQLTYLLPIMQSLYRSSPVSSYSLTAKRELWSATFLSVVLLIGVFLFQPLIDHLQTLAIEVLQ